MKKIKFILTIACAFVVLISCKNNSKTESSTIPKVKAAPKEVKAAPKVDLVANGKALFTSKTCITCHKVDSKLVGPALQTIAKTYKAKNASLLKFFKGESKSIVDPAMAAIMQANVQSITKPMNDADLKALEAYIMSTIN